MALRKIEEAAAEAAETPAEREKRRHEALLHAWERADLALRATFGDNEFDEVAMRDREAKRAYMRAQAEWRRMETARRVLTECMVALDLAVEAHGEG